MVKDEEKGSWGEQTKHIVRRVRSRRRWWSGLGRLARDQDLYEHFFVIEGEKVRCNVCEQDQRETSHAHVHSHSPQTEHSHVIRWKSKQSNLKKFEEEEEETEHEHFVGPYRYKHRHRFGKGNIAHKHDDGDHPDLSARQPLQIVLALCCVLSVIGAVCAGCLLSPHHFGMDLNRHSVALLRIVAPSCLFCGVGVGGACGSYFFVSRSTSSKRRRRQRGTLALPKDDEDEVGEDHIRPLLSSSSEGDAFKDESDFEQPNHYFYLLCLSHTLSAWEDRMWQFAIPVLMMHVFKSTLLPSALFALVQYMGCVFLMPLAGRLIDKSYRLKLLWYAIMVENLSILVTCVALAFMMFASYHTSGEGDAGSFRLTWSLIVCYSVIVVMGVTGEVTNQMQTIALENDWVVVMTGEDSEKLSTMNVILKRIDLMCKVLAPGVIGVFLDLYSKDVLESSLAGIAVVCLWNMLSWTIEYCVLREVHGGLPQLRQKPISDHVSFYERLQHNIQHHSGGTEVGEAHFEGEEENRKTFLDSFGQYWRHPVFLASLAFSLLFMTVLDNGTLITSYLTWRDVSPSILGAQRGIGAIIGLGGTFAFTFLVSKKGKGGVERVGLTSIWFFAFVMAPSVVILGLFGASRASDYALIGGMAVSRAALWMFDLAEKQVMQERIEESSRGVMNSMQTATYQTLFCIIQAFGMIFNKPSEFVILAIISLGSLLSAAFIYTVWYFKYGTRNIIDEEVSLLL